MYGIIGYGIAGRATALLLDKYVPYAIDVNYGDYAELLNKDPEVIFICVPTPSDDSGKLDPSIILEVLERIKEQVANNDLPKQKVVIRSTIDPGALYAFNECYNEYMDIIFMPEFLREKHYEYDARHPDRVIIGVNSLNTDLELAEYIKFFIKYGTSVSDINFQVTSNRIASLVKLSINSFLATKVSFFNEVRNIAPVEFDEVADLVGDDHRIGHSHTNVPGTHGFGFSGKCLPKDLSGLIEYSRLTGRDTKLLSAVQEFNNAIRNPK